MPEKTWIKIANSALFSVSPGGSNQGILAYSGGAFDTKRSRFIIWGGGHQDYEGNEVYAFDCETLKWHRLTNPTPNPTPLSADVLYDGNPGSRHTYNGMAYIAHADRLFETGGSIFSSGSATCASNWFFNFDSNTWSNRSRVSMSGTPPAAGYECSAAYDSVTRKVWWADDGIYVRPNGPGLFSYDYESNTWTKHTSDQLAYRSVAVDTKRGLLIVVGSNQVLAYTIHASPVIKQIWSTTGDTFMVAGSGQGLEYDPVADKIVGFAGDGHIYTLDPETKVWNRQTSGGTAPSPQGRCWNRFRYVPALNAFVTLMDTWDGVYFYKLTANALTACERKPLSSEATGQIIFSVVPNPVRTSTTLRLNGAGLVQSADIYDLSGKLIQKLSVNLDHELCWTVNHQPSGIYVARVRTDKGLMTIKFLLQR